MVAFDRHEEKIKVEVNSIIRIESFERFKTNHDTPIIEI